MPIEVIGPAGIPPRKFIPEDVMKVKKVEKSSTATDSHRRKMAEAYRKKNNPKHLGQNLDVIT